MENRAIKNITAEQIKKIHILKNVLAWHEREYRATLMFNFGVVTSKDLTDSQAGDFIESLEDRAIARGLWHKAAGKNKHDELVNRPGMATPAQLRKIEALWYDTSRARDIKERAKGLRAFLSNHFKVADLRFIRQEKVKKIICALEHMKKGQPPEPLQIYREPLNAA